MGLSLHSIVVLDNVLRGFGSGSATEFIGVGATVQNYVHIYCLYGNSHCKSYSTDHVAVGHLIREIRDTHSVIPHFAQCELDFIVSSASTL